MDENNKALEPEVLAVVRYENAGTVAEYVEAELVGSPAPDGTELIDRAHFTALQARLQAAEARNAELTALLAFSAKVVGAAGRGASWSIDLQARIKDKILQVKP